MFDKLRQLHQLKKQLEVMRVHEEYKGVKVTVNGSMKIVDLEIQNRDDADLGKNVREAVNSALKNMQKKMQKEMTSGGMNMPF